MNIANLRISVPILLGWGLLLGYATSGESRTIDIAFDGENCSTRGQPPRSK